MRWWKRALVAAGLSVLFVVVYGFCNWVTGMRSGVGSFYFGWERGIPFVAWLIVPYMSIDLFFVAAPFLVRSERGVWVLAQRIGFAIVAAGVCFLVMPLRFAFERPHVDGLLGVVFNNFRSLDLPFNEFPSLHVALWMVLVGVYWERLRGVFRAVVMGWFVLILLSTVLTYQHHVVDVVGGFLLGVVCLHFFHQERIRGAFAGNFKVAGCYVLAGLVMMGVGFWWRPWGLVLFWLGGSVAMVGVAYMFVGAGIFRKRGGRVPWTTWVLFWPSLAAQWVSLGFYSRQCRAWDRLTERVWIGRRLTEREGREIVAAGATAVVDLAGELPECGALLGVKYLGVPLLDLTAPLPEEVERAVLFIEEQEKRGVVYVHCKAGYSRTAVVAGAWLIASGRAKGAEEAVGMMRGVRPAMVVRGEAMGALRRFEKAVGATTT